MDQERWGERLRRLLVGMGVVVMLFGVVYAINGATQSPATVRVPVTLTQVAGEQVQVAGIEAPAGWTGWMEPAEPSGVRVAETGKSVTGTVVLAAWGSTRLEQLLSRGDWLVGGLGFLVGTLALSPVLRELAAGRPFAPGNSRRLVVLAVTIAVSGCVAPALPEVAGLLVLERTGLAGPGFASSPSLAVIPLVAAAAVLACAGAFRAGERAESDEP